MIKLLRFIIALMISCLFAADDDAPLNRTRDREVDIQHIKINVTVDIESESVYGHVVHTLSPLREGLESFTLDADDMTVRRVRTGGKDIDFVHLGNKLHITFDKKISLADTIQVRVDYTAFPRMGTYFIKPDDVYPDKPWQAWTQGEDDDNHHWVPIYDYPNDRATFETLLTVDQELKAISNGELVSVKLNDDGTHTWHWHEHFPMVSYLISFVVGDYVKVEDSYNDVPVNYWVYAENQSETMRSFGLTTDMMRYFNEVTGIEYPFEKYDQIILDDFMFGGMENITLTHNTDRTMHDQYAAPDVSSVGLVAHELAHQWYGDMLTTRNWQNIWLNEGFATFLARKYREHKFGYDEGEYIRYGEILSYYSANRRWFRPTVQDKYYAPIDLFDSHIYAKGSLILNMIQDHLGDDAFWRSVQHYTRENMLKNVETSDLKKSIEEVSGQNLDWFFRQWVYDPGFPEYNVSWSYNQRKKSIQVDIEQQQDPEKINLFKMPINVGIDDQVHTIWMDEKNITFELPAGERPKMVVFNQGMRIPCKVDFNKSISEWIIQLKEAPHVLDRIAAINVLKHKKGRRVVENALIDAVRNDPFWGVRREAVTALKSLGAKQQAKELMELSIDQDNRVRRAIWNLLKNYKGNNSVSEFLQNIIDKDEKYYSVSDAFRALVVVDTAAARHKVDRLLNINSHTDVIRKAAISYFGSVKSDQNYARLKELAAYGGTTWDARPEAVRQLSTYIKNKPNTLNLMINFLEDKSRNVRRNAVRAIGNHGREEHLGHLDEVLAMDPIIDRDVRLAKKKITNPSMRTKKLIEIINIDELLIDPEAYLSQLERVMRLENSDEIKKEFKEINKRLEEIKKMLK